MAVITKAEPHESNTNYAQGGVSAVLSPSDSVESHMHDTIVAGAYLCDEDTVRVSSLNFKCEHFLLVCFPTTIKIYSPCLDGVFVFIFMIHCFLKCIYINGLIQLNTTYNWSLSALTFRVLTCHFPGHGGRLFVVLKCFSFFRFFQVVCTEGPDRIRELIAMGASFDHGEDGNLHLAREGGHSHRRIVHAADMTGREIERALLEAVRKDPNIYMFEHHFAIDLLTSQVYLLFFRSLSFHLCF